MASIVWSTTWRHADPCVRATSIFGVTLLASCAMFAPAWYSMAMIWWHNETYAHGMLMPFVSAWLVWRSRASLRGLQPQPAPAALAALALCALAWTIGQLAGVNTLTHFGAVGMVPALIGLCFGGPILTRLAFAMSFLLFAVPFGDFLLPWLMDRTADVTVTALQLSGIPVLREGRNFVLPSGHWSVIEACSGLRYLLAAIPLGLLYAHLNFRSMRTQAVYVAIVLLIALMANWVRAYLIVMLGHWSDMRLAAGVDHLIYGWLFFGLVMGLAFWAGARLPELGPGTAESDRSTSSAAAPLAHRASAHAPRAMAAWPALILAAAAMLLLSAAPYTASHLQQAGTTRIRMQTLQEALIPITDADRVFVPGYDARDLAIGHLPGDPRTVIAVFRYFRQHRDGELATHGNSVMPRGQAEGTFRLVRQTALAATSWRAETPDDNTVTEYEIEGAGRRWIAWEWLWVDGRLYRTPAEVKLATARALLSGRGDESAAILVWTALSDSPGDSAQLARARLAAQALRLRPIARTAGL